MVSITIDLSSATQPVWTIPDPDQFVPGVDFDAYYSVSAHLPAVMTVSVYDPEFPFAAYYPDWSLAGSSSAFIRGGNPGFPENDRYFQFSGAPNPPEPTAYLQTSYTNSSDFSVDDAAFQAAYADWLAAFRATTVTGYSVYVVDAESGYDPSSSIAPDFADLVKVGTVTFSAAVTIDSLRDYTPGSPTPAFFDSFSITGSDFKDQLWAPLKAGTVVSGNDGDDNITLGGMLDENGDPVGSDGAEAHGGEGADAIGVSPYWGLENDPGFGATLYGDDGSDTLQGAGGADKLHGGADDDWLYGAAGADTLDGGEGDDHLDGGEGLDTAVIAGKFADYEIGPLSWVDFDTGMPIESLVLRSSTQAIQMKDVEYLQFDDGTWSVGALTYKSSAALFAEFGKLGFMAQLAKAAYRLLPGEPGYTPSGDAATAPAKQAYDLARANLTLLNWADFPASKPETAGGAGIRDGIFLAANAAALVGRSSDALFVAFRGTNDSSDVAQWINMPGHFALLEGFAFEIAWYLVNNPDVETVYLTGHSLGAAMVRPAIATIEAYFADYYPDVDVAFEAVTFATPGYGNGGNYADPRITNFWTDNDIIQLPTYVKSIGGDQNTFADGIFDAPVFNSSSHSMDLYLALATFLSEEGIDIAQVKSLNGIDYDNFVMKVTEQSGRFYVGVGANTLNGSKLDDAMFGGLSADKLNGAGGRDSLFGGKGTDTLNGGAGKDWLKGGSEADRFVFSKAGETASAARDVILDFNGAEGDRIDVSAIDAYSKQAGNQKFVFIGGESFAQYHKLHPKVFGMIRLEGGVLQGNTDATWGKAEFAIEVNAPIQGAYLIL